MTSDQPAEFVARVPDGNYRAWVLCGTSYPSRYQYFDFEVSSGAATRRVQFEEAPQVRHAFLNVTAKGGEVHLVLKPRSMFAVAGVVLWQEADNERFQNDVLKPIQNLIEFLPPEEAAKWKLVQPVDTAPWIRKLAKA